MIEHVEDTGASLGKLQHVIDRRLGRAAGDDPLVPRSAASASAICGA